MKKSNDILDRFTIRPSTTADSLREITGLLHRAYKRLADMGLNFVATYQDEKETAERIADGQCLIGEWDNKLIATVTYQPQAHSSINCFYNIPGVAMLGQFAVEPAYQSFGLGTALIEEVEQRAWEAGAMELALDTSEKAEHLIEYYERRGFRFIEYVQWERVNYRSVIMSKQISGGAGNIPSVVFDLVELGLCALIS